jgi:protein-tyrosine-phosphatase
MPVSLFVCHANCCRSVLAKYLYDHLCPGEMALSAGVEASGAINDRAWQMLYGWGIDATAHRPTQVTRALCDTADGIFVMGPAYLRWLLLGWGSDLADKAYLFADPFTLPRSFQKKEYLVYDPSWDPRPVPELHRAFSWFRDRVVQIHDALKGHGPTLIPASKYIRTLAQ